MPGAAQKALRSAPVPLVPPTARLLPCSSAPPCRAVLTSELWLPRFAVLFFSFACLFCLESWSSCISSLI